MKPNVYLCGPITGLSYADARYGWREIFRQHLSPEIEILSPMRQEGHLSEIKEISEEQVNQIGHPMSMPRSIIAKDLLDLDRSSLVVACFLGATRVSMGSVFELGYARRAGTPYMLVMEDKGNIHDSLFVEGCAGFRVDNIISAANYTNALLLPGL